MKNHWLNDWVYCGDVGDAFILLDFSQGRYFAIDHEAGRAVEDAINHWPAPKHSSSPPPEVISRQSVIDALVEKGLITSNQPRQNTRRAFAQLAERNVTSLYLSKIPLIETIRICVRFLAAYLFAGFRFRLFSMKGSFEYLRQRKALLEINCLTPTYAQLCELMGHFHRLRALTYTAHDKCVLDSLILADFMLRNRVLPTLIIGVMTRPFEAHCWVQSGSVVLNDGVERARSRPPVLVV